MLLIISIFVVLYALSTLLYIHFGKNQRFPDLNPHQYDFFSSRELIKTAEEALQKNPDDYKLRLSLLSTFIQTIDARDLQNNSGLDHALWLVKNAPEYASGPECGALFGLCDQHGLAVKAWKAVIEEKGAIPKYLQLAANACAAMDDDFATQCALKWHKLEPLNPQVHLQLAQLATPGFSDLEAPLAQTREKWKHYQQYLRYTWTEENFLNMNKLRKAWYGFLWPEPIATLLLKFMGNVNRHLLRWRESPYDLAQAGIAAFTAEDFTRAKKLSSTVQSMIPQWEKDNAWESIRSTAYNLAILIALRENNFEDVDRYLAKKSFPAKSGFDFGFNDEAVIIALMRAGQQPRLYQFMLKRAEKIKNDPYAIRYLRIVADGLIPDRNTLNDPKYAVNEGRND